MTKRILTESLLASRPDPTRIPMGGVDKCLICGWQGRPDEPHGCPRYRTSTRTPRPGARNLRESDYGE